MFFLENEMRYINPRFTYLLTYLQLHRGRRWQKQQKLLTAVSGSRQLRVVVLVCMNTVGLPVQEFNKIKTFLHTESGL